MEATLKATPRETRGKNEARRLRQAGQVPGTVYGGASGVSAIAVDAKVLSRILHSDAGVNSLISLEIEGEPAAKVLVKEYQVEPVRHALLHADFYRVAMDKLLTITVPIVLKGEPRGVKQQGGVLDFVHREIEIQCLPADIPEHVEIDVSDLMLGQSIRLRDVSSATWTPVSEADLMLVHVVAARTVVEEAPAAEAAAAAPTGTAEPEVIKKGKAEKADE